MRVLAHITQDESMKEAFINGDDIHTATAMKVFGVEADQVDSLMRRQAKAVNFGIVYGISDYGLSQSLGITRKKAKAFIDDYLASFPGVKQYMSDIVKDAKALGYVKHCYIVDAIFLILRVVTLIYAALLNVLL